MAGGHGDLFILFFCSESSGVGLASEPNPISDAIGYAKFYSRSHDAVIRVYDEAGSVIESQKQVGDFKER